MTTRFQNIVLTVILCLTMEAFADDAPRTAAAAAVKPAAANPLDPNITKQIVGDWKNELSPPSTLSIQNVDSQTGAITGTYTSLSGGGPTAYPLVGWVNDKTPKPGENHVIVISFTVRFGEHGSITAWNGTFKDGAKPSIVGQWVLARPNSQFDWDHLLTGQDRYSK